jgi:hypothetical protein
MAIENDSGKIVNLALLEYSHPRQTGVSDVT